MQKGQASRQSNSKLLLVALFLFLFAVPVLVLGPLISSSLFEEERSSDEAIYSAVQADGLDIDKAGTFLKVAGAADLSPVLGKDFLIVSWFNLRSLPQRGESMPVLSHRSTRNGKGYAIALSRTSKEFLRPEVYLSFDGRSGGWYKFSDVKILPGQWFLLAMAYYENRYLGTFVGTYDYTGKVQLKKTGGYEIRIPWKPYKNQSLKVGAVKTGSFRGNIGPVGIFSADNLRTRLSDLLLQFMKEPSELPRYLNDENMLFWSPDGKQDLSPAAHEISMVDAFEKKQEKRIEK